MITGGRRAALYLLTGDIVAFAAALYLTLWLRYGVVPKAETLTPYLLPFTFIFALWVLVFYSAGLYSKRLTLFPSRLPDALLWVQMANIIFAALFFFLIPAFGITPKTILALYLLISLALVFFWRLTLYPWLSIRRSRERVVLIASGEEAEELYTEVNGNPRYGIEFFPQPRGAAPTDRQALLREIEQTQANILVVDSAHAEATHSMQLIYSLTRTEHRYQFVSFADMYEEVFDRIPLSRLSYTWFLENVSSEDSMLYAAVKRGIDSIGGLFMGLTTLVAIPFIFIANRLEGPGSLFIKQDRLGRYGVPIKVYKFRSMKENIAASDEWTHEGENRITKVGAFLRHTSLDEFPQFINVIRGELSLSGPRSDILGLGKRLAKALPYYEARYLVVPGITGWAQINQQYVAGNVSPQSIEETKVRLAYDFYYLKHRSLGLDIIIALKTVKRMFFRVSSW